VDELKVRLASRNTNKARELEHLLPGWTIEALEADDYPAEDGSTYYENARGKALFGRIRAEPDEWALGEDSGIEVAALDNAPGVRSARSGGEDPVRWLLDALSGEEDRRARYVSELVLVSPAGDELRGVGILEGTIADDARGTEGFGFDPVFVPTGESLTVAELGNEWKRGNSHRAGAVRDLVAALGQSG
jgi:XTP/dITP diphosphohydrolase